MGKKNRQGASAVASAASSNDKKDAVITEEPAATTTLVSSTPAASSAPVSSTEQEAATTLPKSSSSSSSTSDGSVEELGDDDDEDDEVDKNKFKLDDGSIIDYSETPDEQGIINANAAAEEMFYLRRAEELEQLQEEEEKIRTDKGIPILDFRAKYEDEKVNGKKYHLITWDQLKRVFCYERAAHGFMIAGDISQKHTQHWDRSKQIKVRDHECKVEGAVFFYDENSPEPHFSWDKVEVGNYVEIKSPRLHKFMDGQDGLRIEDNSIIGTVRKRTFDEAKRFEYGKLNKDNGNTKYLRAMKMLQEIAEEEEEKKREKLLDAADPKKKKKGEAVPSSAFRSVSAGNRMLDDAIVSYEMAISHLECTFTTFPAEQRLEVRKVLASCFLNVAACQIAQKKWDTVEMPCDKALSINASKQLNAKAYYRIAQAMLEMGSPRKMAEEKLKRAQLILQPEADASINGLLHKIAVMEYEEKQQEKLMFRNRREAREQKAAASSAIAAVDGEKNDHPTVNTANETPSTTDAADCPSPFSPNVPTTQSFGLKRSMFGPPPIGINGAPNFRDLGGLPCNDSRRVMKKYVLYRSNTLCLATSSAALEGALGEFSDATDPDYSITTTAVNASPAIMANNKKPTEDAKMRHLKEDLAFIPPADTVRTQEIIEPKNIDDEENNKEEEGSNSDSDEEGKKKKGPVKTTWSLEPFNDIKTLVDDFGIKTIIDFRNEHEAREQIKRLKTIRGGMKSKKWFQNYQDMFTVIKVICANDDKTPTTSADNNTNSSSSTNDVNDAEARRAMPARMVVGAFKSLFLLAAGGGTYPTPFLDPSATRKRKVWLSVKNQRSHIFKNGLLAPAPDTSKNLSLTTPAVSATNGAVKPWSKSEIALQDALVNHPVIFRVDLVTRGLISLTSYWLLFALAICALFGQIRFAATMMVKYVVNKQTQKDLFMNILKYQGPEIAHVFSILSNPRSYPVVLSCTLGKDRTGIITALVLAACDVKFEAILKDFSDRTNAGIASAPFLLQEQRRLGLKASEWDTVKPATLKEIFVFLKTEYGGVLGYLRSIGVSDEQILRMRNLLTRPVSS